jgi:hypothetical protein
VTQKKKGTKDMNIQINKSTPAQKTEGPKLVLPCHQLAGGDVISDYVKPEVLNQIFLIHVPSGTKTLFQIEREQNPNHKYFGKEFLCVRPGMKWVRVGFFGQSRQQAWVNYFQEFKPQVDPNTGEVTQPHIGQLTANLVKCVSAENGGSFGDWSIELYEAKAKAD